ncbi:hypothetical protein OI18_09950 [Flavihumibacter solisilvae]|uniref:Glycosyl transferase family 1 domain-containing protein n=2 Tax=Flavihumibacter solisilvae TaxID=1349421 RepID=A0A0C1LHH0_9BACT|nr:hypothetical protein OI18_09950 [Flavihumibacter solisilvae]
MAFRKKNQFAPIVQNLNMKVLAYFIDSLLNDLASPASQSLLNAIPSLAEDLPGFRHIALTTHSDVSLDPGGTLELVQLKVSGSPLMGKQFKKMQAIKKWLSENQPCAWITTDPETITADLGIPAIFIANPTGMLSATRKKGMFGKSGAADWLSADRIITGSGPAKEQLMQVHSIPAEKIKVIYPAFEDPVEPLDWGTKEHVKLRYSSGRDYFMYTGPLAEEQQLIMLLKSYSQLKKWLMTGMPLILAGPATEYTATFEKQLATYKYRSDVSLYPDLAESECKELVAGAYALLSPTAANSDLYPLEWAFSSETPVIAPENATYKDLCGDAAMYYIPGDIDSFAHAMMILYKDENRRTEVITKGKERSALINRDNSLKQYRDLILELCG